MSKGHTHMRFGVIAYPRKPLTIAHSGVSRWTRSLKNALSLFQRSYFCLQETNARQGHAYVQARWSIFTRRYNMNHHLVC